MACLLQLQMDKYSSSWEVMPYKSCTSQLKTIITNIFKEKHMLIIRTTAYSLSRFDFLELPNKCFFKWDVQRTPSPQKHFLMIEPGTYWCWAILIFLIHHRPKFEYKQLFLHILTGASCITPSFICTPAINVWLLNHRNHIEILKLLVMAFTGLLDHSIQV